MKVAVIGGTGYGAVELTRFLHHHPYVKLEQVISHSQAGVALSQVYPHLITIVDQPMDELKLDEMIDNVDLIFFATPTSVSSKLAPSFIEQGIICIDLSGDFRLNNREQYQDWYGYQAADQLYLDQAVYGLSEIYREQIKKARLIANPGCYPTATLLGLIPALQSNKIKASSIIVDGKTGTSGAGRSTSLTMHYSEMNENVVAYQLGQHKHIPEMERYLSETVDQPIQLNFTPHIVPMTRGIMTTIYADLAKEISQAELIERYQTFYQDDPFIRIRSNGTIPATKHVYGSNYCDIALHIDQRTGKLIVVSVIDNLVKGAAGQAIQNMNILFNWDEQTGLNQIPLYP